MLAIQFGGNSSAAARALNAVTETITYQTAGGEKVTLTGFGSFEKVHRSAGWCATRALGNFFGQGHGWTNLASDRLTAAVAWMGSTRCLR